MISKRLKNLILVVCLIPLGCLEPYVDCDCAEQLNISLKIFEGSNSTCIADANIKINGMEPTNYFDSTSCIYSIATGAGNNSILLSKNGFDEVETPVFQINYHDDGCCGKYDEKKIDVIWYPSADNKEPKISIE